MTVKPGIVVNQGFLPSAEDLASVGLLQGWVRCLVTDVEQFDRDLQSLGWPSSVRLCALLEGQTQGVGNDFAGWRSTIRNFAPSFQGRVHAVECANELDIWHLQPPIGDPNPELTPAFAADVVLTASPFLRAAGMQVIAPAVASGRWFDYLAEMTDRMGDAADLQAFHPYGKKIENHPPHAEWEELTDAVGRAREIARRPLALTELGVKVGEAGGPAGQAEYVRRLFGLMHQQPPGAVEFFCYFAWKDGIEVPGEGVFGLIEAGGRWRAACREFQRACGGPSELPSRPVVPPPAEELRFQMGFAQWASLEPELLGNPTENESSPHPGLALQRTTRGLLLWANLDGGVYLFQDLESGARHLWQDGWSASQPAQSGRRQDGRRSSPRRRSPRRRTDLPKRR
jgi:hypothetical protein